MSLFTELRDSRNTHRDVKAEEEEEEEGHANIKEEEHLMEISTGMLEATYTQYISGLVY